jgi:hypothetical protein
MKVNASTGNPLSVNEGVTAPPDSDVCNVDMMTSARFNDATIVSTTS